MKTNKIDWLKKMYRLNRHGPEESKAPHKPLLLLVLLDLVESGELSDRLLELTPQLAFRFSVYAGVVAHRRSQAVVIRYPFYHLSSDGFWRSLDSQRNETKNRERTHYALLEESFFQMLQDQDFRTEARLVLISTYFEGGERAELYAIANMTVPSDAQVAEQIDFQALADAEKKGRQARFRISVLYSYGFMCSLTRYRLTTIDNESIVDAAHIHQFSASGNNDPRNGLALCKNAHWLFDCGLWTLTDDLRVIVAKTHFDEESADPMNKRLIDYDGQKIHLPKNQSAWPDPQYIKWHRDHRFKGREKAASLG
jgi:putative restriction endonuclease